MSVPRELRVLPQWVLWRYEERDGELTKVPCQPSARNRRASSTDSSTWGTFEEAIAAATPGYGVGFVFTDGDPFAGIDCDHCVNGDNVHPAVVEIVKRLDSYTELSPSGAGVHVIVRAAVNGGRKRTSATPWGSQFENYSTGRFFCFTGKHLPGTPLTINDRQEQLDALRGELLPVDDQPHVRQRDPAPASMDDVELLERARNAKNGVAFDRLWGGDTSGYDGDDSRADLALCGMLAFWCGPDPGRIDALFRRSGLMREKWDDRRGESTYGAVTIERALSGRTEFYGGGAPLVTGSARAHDPAAFGRFARGENVGNVGNPPRGTHGPDLSYVSYVSSTPEAWPAALDDAALHGLAGEVVRAVEPHTEADPVAILATFLAAFGNAVGRGPHILRGDDEHGPQQYVCVVGDTSTGRKGTSWSPVRRIMREADPSWSIASGLVSGEGVIHHVRDPRQERRRAKTEEEKRRADDDGYIEEIVDAGVDDKRLFVIEAEFARVLGAIERKDNTLSAVLRELWDRGEARTLAKNAHERTTGALVGIVAHVTPQELRARLSTTEMANGFANRFMFVCSRRSKLLPRGGSVPDREVGRLAALVREALEFAPVITRVELEPAAEDMWAAEYPRLTSAPAGLLGAVTGRAAPIVLRLALIYALLNGRPVITEDHLRAALAVWRYSEASARHLFGTRLGDGLADRLHAMLVEAGPEGLTRSEMRDRLGGRVSADRISDALALLSRSGLVRGEHQETGGRPAERWHAEAAR